MTTLRVGTWAATWVFLATVCAFKTHVNLTRAHFLIIYAFIHTFTKGNQGNGCWGPGPVPPNFILFFSPEFFEDILGKERSKEIGPSRFLFFFKFLVFFWALLFSGRSHTLTLQAQTGQDSTVFPGFHGSVHRFIALPICWRVGVQVPTPILGEGGEQPPPGAAWLSRSVNPKGADRKLVLRN